MAAATGTVVISSAGGDFDSADYPRFVLGDGTNTLTFVLDKDATRLQTRYDGEYATAYTASSQLPFEDSQRGRLAVPTYDLGSATKGSISIIASDAGNASTFWNNTLGNKSDNSGLRDITARPHWVLRDADGNEIKVGFGTSNATSLTNNNAVLLAKYGSTGSPRYWLYRENSSSRNYFIRVVNNGNNSWKLHQALFGAFKYAYRTGQTNVDVQGIGQTGNLMSASVGNDTYTSAQLFGLLLSYETAGAKGNACSLIFNDPQAVAASASTRQQAISWGYDEYAASNVMNIARHSDPQEDANSPQYWATNLTNEVYFKGGTKAGTGAALSTADIAEALKDMVNGSRLGITAARSDSTVNLTNDTDGDVGNVTITTTNEGSLFSVSGMSNAGGGGGNGGTSIMARTRIGSKLIAIGGLTKDNVSSGSIEVKHLSFGDLGAGDFVTDLQDADTLALSSSRGASAGMRGLTLGALKSFISASQLTNITASGDVLIGDGTGDSLNVTARIISSLIPKTDGLNDLGSNALAWNTVFAESGSFSDNVGIGNNLTVSDTVSAATVSGSASTFHDLAADDLTVGGIVASSITASNGVLLGSSNADDLGFLGGQITDLVPQNDNKVALGSATKRYSLISAMSASVAGAVGVVGTVTAGGVTSGGTISGSIVSAATLNVGTKATMVHADINDSLEVAGYAGFAGGVAISGTLSLAGTAVTSTAAEINLLDGSAANTVVGSVAAIYGTTGQLTASAMTVGGTISGSTGNFEDLTADNVTLGGLTVNSLTASNGVMIGTAVTDDVSFLGGLITDLVPQNDSKVDLGTSSKQFAEAHIDTGNIDTVVATALTASHARITNLDVDTIVSRTVTKDSLEIKDNLIIAGVSGSVAGDFVGAGFQLGGKVGVSGTGSAPLMSMTLGNRSLTGDSLIVNVDGQAGASFMSGGVTMGVLGTPGMRFGVTGSISGSLVQAKRIEAGHLALRGALTSTNLSGATVNAHDITADDAVFGGLTLSSITASNGVLLGSSNADDLAFLGGQITDLVPQNDNKVALGSATKRYSLVSAMSASIAGAVGIVGTATVGALTSAGTISGSTATVHDLTAEDVTAGGISASSITASNGVLLGSSNADDLGFLGGQITDLVPQNDNKVALGSAAKRYSLISAMSASIAGAVGIVGTATVGALSSAGAITCTGPSSAISGAMGQFNRIDINRLIGKGVVTQDNLQTGSVLTAAILDANVTTAKLAANSVTKAKLNDDIIQNNSDAHGGLVISSGRLSVGFRKDVFVRSDGSNISGTVPTHGMFATKAVPTPYTTASLGAQPVSGTIMVYLNGILLHGDHHQISDAGRNIGSSDYHMLTASANAYKILLNEDLALDSDDILTVTYLSGSGGSW